MKRSVRDYGNGCANEMSWIHERQKKKTNVTLRKSLGGGESLDSLPP